MYMLVRESYNPGTANVYSRIHRAGEVFWTLLKNSTLLKRLLEALFWPVSQPITDDLLINILNDKNVHISWETQVRKTSMMNIAYGF